MRARETFDNIAGKICEAALPIRKEYVIGRGTSVAICTLSNIELLERISQMPAVMDRIAVVGRLLSENRGIDVIIRFAIDHPSLERILLCGLEVRGHLAGQALLSVAKYGIDETGKIIGAIGPYPKLRSSPKEITRFRDMIKIVDYIGLTDADKAADLIS